MYWCDRCATEVPAAEIFQRDGQLMHRRGSDIGELDGEVHAVRQLADSHEPYLTADPTRD